MILRESAAPCGETDYLGLQVADQDIRTPQDDYARDRDKRPCAYAMTGLAGSRLGRLKRTLVIEWAYRQVFTSNVERRPPLLPGSSTTTLDATALSAGFLRSAA